MWFFILSFIVLVLGIGLIYKKQIHDSEWSDWEDFAVFSTIWIVVVIFFVGIIGMGIILPTTTGLVPDYKQGEAVGYLTHFKNEGLIWKTWEGRYLAGVGKQTAVGEAYSFSVVDGEIVEQIKTLVGSDVRVKMAYDCWFMLPYKMGSTNCLVTKVEVEHENNMRRYDGRPAPIHGLRLRP